MKKAFFYIILFVFCLAFSLNLSNFDFDLWARLIVGASVVATGVVPKQDFLSYTPTHNWYDHEWGSGVIFYLTQSNFGGIGLLVLQSVLIFLIFFTVSKVIKLRTQEPPFNIFFYFIAFQAMISAVSSPIRCHLFSFLFFTVFIYILELARKGNNKPLFVLPFLMIIWNNLHGGCVSGIGLICIYILGEYLNKNQFKKYAFALIPTVLVLPINPYGFEYLGFLLSANTMKRPDIVEWWGLFSPFHLLGFIKFKLFMFAIMFVEFFTVFKNKAFKNFDRTKFLLILFTLFLSLRSIKLLPFFVIVSACFVYEDFYKLLGARVKKVLNISTYIIVILYCATSFSAKNFEPKVNFSLYPVKEVEFVKQNNLDGKILLNFGLGSYASYKLYPDNLIFMDGRYEEVYYDYMMPLLKKFFLVNPGWDEVLSRFTPDVMIIEKYYPVYKKLQESNWTLVYEGKTFGVFLPSKTATRKFVLPSDDVKYYQDRLFERNF